MRLQNELQHTVTGAHIAGRRVCPKMTRPIRNGYYCFFRSDRSWYVYTYHSSPHVHPNQTLTFTGPAKSNDLPLTRPRLQLPKVHNIYLYTNTTTLRKLKVKLEFQSADSLFSAFVNTAFTYLGETHQPLDHPSVDNAIQPRFSPQFFDAATFTNSHILCYTFLSPTPNNSFEDKETDVSISSVHRDRYCNSRTKTGHILARGFFGCRIQVTCLRQTGNLWTLDTDEALTRLIKY